MPNGRNEDGSLNNTRWTNDELIFRTFPSTINASNSKLIFDLVGTDYDSHLRYFGSDTYLDDDTNTWVTTGTGILKTGLYLTLGDISLNSGVISNFQPKLPFRAVDYNDIRSEVDGKVSKSGDTMSGPLNFNESPIVHDFISNGNRYIQRTNRILSNADPVDSNIYVSGISIVDETNYEIAKTEIAKLSDGTIRHNFLAHNINGVGTGWTAIGVGYKPNGTPITYAPTPPTGDNSSQIATTAWVKALPRLIETWESDWFTSPGASKSVSFNLAGTGMNATNAPRIFIEMIGKVVTVDSGYAVGDIIYPQFANYNGSTGGREEGQSVFFRGNTLTYAQGNSTSWVGTKATGGQDGVDTAHIQIKIILRRFSN